MITVNHGPKNPSFRQGDIVLDTHNREDIYLAVAERKFLRLKDGVVFDGVSPQPEKIDLSSTEVVYSFGPDQLELIRLGNMFMIGLKILILGSNSQPALYDMRGDMIKEFNSLSEAAAFLVDGNAVCIDRHRFVEQK